VFPARDQGLDPFTAGGFSLFRLEIDGDEVQHEIRGVRGLGTSESEILEVGEQIRTSTCINKMASPGKQKNTGEMVEDIGSGLVYGKNDGPPFSCQSVEHIDDRGGRERIQTRCGFV